MNEPIVIEQPQSPTIDYVLAANPELRQQVMGDYDNEWVRFMEKISTNKSLKDIAEYIDSVHWSRRQKKTLMAYCRVIMGDVFATTNFRDLRDYRMLYDDKALIDCDLTVGLTRFDLTPEWNILLGMINIHFGATSRMSKGGWFVSRIGAQRHEIVQEDKHRDQNIGFKEKLNDTLFGRD